MLCPEELAASVTAAAIAISHAIPDNRAVLLAAVFTQLGDTLTTIVEARSLFQDSGNLPNGSVESSSNGSPDNSSGE